MLRPDAQCNINLLEKGLIKKSRCQRNPRPGFEQSMLELPSPLPFVMVKSLTSLSLHWCHLFFSPLPLQFSKLAYRASHSSQ